MTNRHFYITLLSLLCLTPDALAQTTNGTPRLVVSITIDQLRTDYLEAFSPLYSDNGFKKLMSQGMVFVNAYYPFTPVDRASATASISTGTTPFYHSIVGSKWLNRETLRPADCVEDRQFPGLNTSDFASPTGLATSTLGDELKVATGGKALVYSIAPYRDAAVLLAGHAADAAIWIDDAFGDWCTSSYYTSTIPVWLKVHNDVNAPGRKISNAVWEPLHELAGNYNYYLQTTNDRPFRHKFTGDRRFMSYKESGLINSDITDIALQCMGSMGLGNDRVTDLLCLTYYAGSYGHQRVTDCQMELQDTYLRLDVELSRLMAYTDRTLGTDNVLYVITSTGYDDVEPVDYTAFRIPTGTFYMTRTANLLNMYLGAIWGQGSYVETTFRNQIFLNHRLLETRHISIGDATSRAQEMVAMMSGVRNVYTSTQLLANHSPLTEKVRNAFNPQRCGDLIIEAAPGWQIMNEDTHESHMSVASFTQFPIIFFGSGINAERVLTPVATDRIAPSVARTIRIRAPNACSAEPLF